MELKTDDKALRVVEGGDAGRWGIRDGCCNLVFFGEPRRLILCFWLRGGGRGLKCEVEFEKIINSNSRGGVGWVGGG